MTKYPRTIYTAKRKDFTRKVSASLIHTGPRTWALETHIDGEGHVTVPVPVGDHREAERAVMSMEDSLAACYGVLAYCAGDAYARRAMVTD